MDISRQTMAGSLFILAGLLLLGVQAGVLPGQIPWRWWPIGLVVAGVAHGPLTRDGFAWIGWGVLLLLWTTGVLSWGQAWPLALIIHGGMLVFWPNAGCGRRKVGRHAD